MKNIKEEVLTAIKERLDLNSYDEFEHIFEGEKRSSSSVSKQIESENYLITIEFTETVTWSSHEDCEFYDMEITSIIVEDQDSEIDVDIKESEILQIINY